MEPRSLTTGFVYKRRDLNADRFRKVGRGVKVQILGRGGEGMRLIPSRELAGFGPWEYQLQLKMFRRLPPLLHIARSIRISFVTGPGLVIWPAF